MNDNINFNFTDKKYVDVLKKIIGKKTGTLSKEEYDAAMNNVMKIGYIIEQSVLPHAIKK